MLIATIALFSPALLVELSIKRVFPEGANNWDRIGLFKLQDGERERLVLLFCHDSDSVAGKALASCEVTSLPYPNRFLVHAIYQGSWGRWIHKEVFGYARVRFTQVEKTAPDHVILQCRPNFMIRFEAGDDINKALKRAEEINKPFQKRVLFVDGVLTAK